MIVIEIAERIPIFGEIGIRSVFGIDAEPIVGEEKEVVEIGASGVEEVGGFDKLPGEAGIIVTRCIMC